MKSILAGDVERLLTDRSAILYVASISFGGHPCGKFGPSIKTAKDIWGSRYYPPVQKDAVLIHTDRDLGHMVWGMDHPLDLPKKGSILVQSSYSVYWAVSIISFAFSPNVSIVIRHEGFRSCSC